jgi:hypothetical protein
LPGGRLPERTTHSSHARAHWSRPGARILRSTAAQSVLRRPTSASISSNRGLSFLSPKSVVDEAMLSRHSWLLVDLARDKPATQSSHSDWSRGTTAEEVACRAVSGELSSDYGFHTASEDNPRWQVDLTKDCAVGFIEITNRPDHPYRFTRFRVNSSSDNRVWVTQSNRSGRPTRRPSITHSTVLSHSAHPARRLSEPRQRWLPKAISSCG